MTLNFSYVIQFLEMQRPKCLQTGHGNADNNYGMGGTILCRTVGLNVKVSVQCIIAACRPTSCRWQPSFFFE